MHPVFRTGLAGLLLALDPAPALGQASPIAGDWLGTSICVDRQHFPACKDEHGSWASEVRTARFHLLLELQVAGDRLTGTLTDLGVGYRVRDIRLERAK